MLVHEIDTSRYLSHELSYRQSNNNFHVVIFKCLFFNKNDKSERLILIETYFLWSKLVLVQEVA